MTFPAVNSSAQRWAKILLLNPDVLLLDEPTKGLDAEFKQVFGQILRTLQASGVAILMVSHDIEFCAKYADRCALFFDGNIVTESTPKTFFSGNSFYTTAANRIARDVLPDAVTPEDVIAPAAVQSNRNHPYRNTSASRPHRRKRRGRRKSSRSGEKSLPPCPVPLRWR